MRGKYRKGIFIVVYRKTKDGIKYLVLKRKWHWKGWEFPKGGVEKGETDIETVKRETREETGQEAFNIKKFNIFGKYKYDKLYKDRPGYMGQSYELYSVEVRGSRVKIDKKEHSAYKWLSFRDAMKILTWDDQKKCLQIVNDYLSRKSFLSRLFNYFYGKRKTFSRKKSAR